jgi:hypothetical protein
VRESKIERYAVKRVKEIGGMCIKITSPGLVGMPDRLILLPDGAAFFAELKATHGRLSPAQHRRHAELRKVGQEVEVWNSIEKIDEVFGVPRV